MILLEVDPDVVKPGWTPLIITILLGVAVVLLYLSMRRQFSKISIPRDDEDDAEPEADLDEGAPTTAPPPTAAPKTEAPTREDPPAG